MLFLIVLLIFVGISIFITVKMSKLDENIIKKHKYDRMNLKPIEVPKKETLNEAIKRFDISSSLIQSQPNSLTYILDRKNHRISALTFKESPRYEYDIFNYNFKNIVDVSVIIDKETITSTTNEKQLKGSLIGGVLAGTTGAIIGSQSGRKNNVTTSIEMVSMIHLKLLLVNAHSTNVKIIFLNTKEPVLKSSITFVNAYNHATEWEDELRAYILESRNKQKDGLTKHVNTLSIADEIKKLHTLVEDGILTNEEFALQKEKILSK